MDNYYYVYILTNDNNSVLYTGVTNDLIRRIYEHKNKIDPKSFTARYNTSKLVYYETTQSVESAILREKQIKSGSRQSKMRLINSFNPEWKEITFE